MKTLNRAQGHWQTILVAAGIEERSLRNVHGPCPVCAGSDRFRYDDKDGMGTFYCTHCGPGTGFKLLKRFTGHDDKEALAFIDSVIGVDAQPTQTKDPEPDLRKRRTWMRKLWAESNMKPWDYLAERGLPKEQMAAIGLRNLNLHPRMALRESRELIGRYPTMVAPVLTPQGQCAALHRTYLLGNGVTSKKLTPTIRPMEGSAIRLVDPKEASILVVSEGIETALSALMICLGARVGEDLSYACWATISANGMKNLEVDDRFSGLVICGDNDSSFTGQEAAYTLARRMVAKQKSVCVRIPQQPDNDFNDVWLSRIEHNQ